MLGNINYLMFVGMNAKEAKKKIDKLKASGIQNSALANQMGMSSKVFSTRLSSANWSESELEKLEEIIAKYPQ